MKNMKVKIIAILLTLVLIAINEHDKKVHKK